MQNLVPFTPISQPISVRGELARNGGELHLRFELSDPQREVLDSLVAGSAARPVRADLLWQTTCFEAFIGAPGEGPYWEFNFSGDGSRWNCYRFDSYRKPAPPVASKDFECLGVKVSEKTIECRLAPKVPISALEASLCAVIRTAAGPSYFSIKHAGAKADFHLRDSFVVRC